MTTDFTPSKQAAASLSNLDLSSYDAKASSSALNAKLLAQSQSTSPSDASTPKIVMNAPDLKKNGAVAADGEEANDEVDEKLKAVEGEELEEYRTKFVGEDIEEKDEPLLKESNSRFVLFPIKYREVSR